MIIIKFTRSPACEITWPCPPTHASPHMQPPGDRSMVIMALWPLGFYYVDGTDKEVNSRKGYIISSTQPVIKHISKEDSQKENMCSREAVFLPGPVWPQAWALISSLCTLLTSQIPGSTVMLASPNIITCLHLNNPDCESHGPSLPAYNRT